MERKTRPRNPVLAAEIAKSGKTLTRIAMEAEIDRGTLGRILGQRQAARTETAQRLASVLGPTPDELGLELYNVPVQSALVADSEVAP